MHTHTRSYIYTHACIRTFHGGEGNKIVEDKHSDFGLLTPRCTASDHLVIVMMRVIVMMIEDSDSSDVQPVTSL